MYVIATLPEKPLRCSLAMENDAFTKVVFPNSQLPIYLGKNLYRSNHPLISLVHLLQ